MIRGTRLYALFLIIASRSVSGHPLCYFDTRPTDFTEVLTFCPAQEEGACCNDLEEAVVVERFDAVGPITGDCAGLYQEVVCGVCHSYSGHLYERLGAELGALDGLTMKNDFCQELVSACEGQIIFPTYDGEDYCTKHTGGNDQFWSYPYTPAVPPEPGLNEVFSGVDFPSRAIGVHQTPDGGQYWIMGQDGEIISVDAGDSSVKSTVVDISSGTLYTDYEEGLLDFAFGPMFSELGYPSYFYLSYTCILNDGENQRNRLSKFEYFPDDAAATLASEEVLLTSSPRSSSIHAGGWVAFQPSSYGNAAAAYHDIYWTTGDAGPQTDPDNNGQDTSNLHGSMMRISVPSEGTGYLIPSGNLASPALPEICANGFRNPWKCSFDKDTDELYCGDVGHTLVEEVDLIECGNNYGWSRFEGSRCQEAQEERDGSCQGASRFGFTFPTYEYCHPDYYSDDPDEAAFVDGVDICGNRQLLGTAIIGGYVYRGQYFADVLGGAYVFGDLTNKNVYFIKKDDGEWTLGTIISDNSISIIGFSESTEGELMLLSEDYNIYHLPCGDLCSSTCLEQADVTPTYESLGCFADYPGDRALEISVDDSCGPDEKTMSPMICASYCSTLGATQAGVEFGFECYCGFDSDYSKHGTSADCTYLCDGNSNELCGGFDAIEVFQLGAGETTSTSAEALEDGPIPAYAVP